MPADITTIIARVENKPTHKEQLALTARLVKQLRRILSAQCSSDRPQASSDTLLLLRLVCLAMLGQRGLAPTLFNGCNVEPLLKSVAANEPPQADASFFATQLVGPLGLAELRFPGATELALARLFQQPWAQDLLADPLAPGWVYQHLSRQPRARLTGLPPGSNVQSASARNVSPELVPALTQWFTPKWIADFLVNETIDSYLNTTGNSLSRLRFLDPACGAGHLLVPALNRLVREAVSLEGKAPAAALATVLSSHLYGCDIDPLMIQLSGFSIYLAARQIASNVELPVPQLFCFGDRNESGSDSALFGSFCLGVKDCQPDAELTGPAGQLKLSDFAGPYSIIVTNPPFLGHRLIPAELAAFIKRHYNAGRFDLYAAFLSLCSRLLAEGGRMAMICQQSFMSITRYEALRVELMESCDIEALVQLGAGAFGSVSGEKVNNAIIIAAKRGEQIRSAEPISCWRILDQADKQQAELSGIRSIQALQQPRTQFATKHGASFSFWCPSELMRLFDEHPPLQSAESGIDCVNGLFTCNNSLFVKHHREVSDDDRQNWAPYDKGGGHKWYRSTKFLLNWGSNGESIRQYRLQHGQSACLPGERYYFKPGITYSYIGTKGFSARLLSPGSIFDIASSSLFSRRIDLMFVLGLLNSALARFLLGVLNPTVNFQIGDLRRIPFAIPDSTLLAEIADSAGRAVEIAKKLETFDPDSPHFAGPVLFRYASERSGSEKLAEAYREHIQQLETLCNAESECQNRIDRAVFELYRVSAAHRTTIIEDPWVARTNKRLANVPSFDRCRTEAAKHLAATSS